MTLGEYIKRLEKCDPQTTVKIGLGNPHSWRGSYCEISFEPIENMTVGDMLKHAKSAVGATYQGYKGGEFKMSKNTTINVDYEGHWSDGGVIWGIFLDLLLSHK